MVIGKKPAQEGEMRFAPGGDGVAVVAVVAVGDTPAHQQQQQHFRQGMRHLPRLAWVLDPSEMVQQRPKTGLPSKFRHTAPSRLLRISGDSENHAPRKS